MKYAVILLCAGKGKRLKKKADKAFVRIGNTPLFYYSYSTFSKLKYFSQIVIVARKKYFNLIRRYTKNNHLTLVTGGQRRQDSVYKGLTVVRDDIDYVFIHDGARPFVAGKLINTVKNNVIKFNAVIPAIRHKDALKIVKKGFVKKSLDRDNLWYVQTPQAFRKGLLFEAYGRFRKKRVYDDADMVMFLGSKVKIVEGDYLNIKITYPEDLFLAEAILRIKNNSS